MHTRAMIASANDEVRSQLRSSLQARYDEVVAVTGGDDVLQSAHNDRFDLVVLDEELEEPSSLSLLWTLRDMGLGTTVLLLSSLPRRRRKALAMGAEACVAKPFPPGAVSEALDRCG